MMLAERGLKFVAPVVKSLRSHNRDGICAVLADAELDDETGPRLRGQLTELGELAYELRRLSPRSLIRTDMVPAHALHNAGPGLAVGPDNWPPGLCIPAMLGIA
jgi:hypothetical protein